MPSGLYDRLLVFVVVRYNISYGDRDASDEQIEAAATAADIHHTINSLPQGAFLF